MDNTPLSKSCNVVNFESEKPVIDPCNAVSESIAQLVTWKC